MSAMAKAEASDFAIEPFMIAPKASFSQGTFLRGQGNRISK
jgi:hypothetical protein